MERIRMVFSGSGGQGVITAAVIIAEAAVLYENLVAVQSQSYGAQARGGATKADIIISDSEINFPKVNNPNLLVCLTQEAYTQFSPTIRPGGFLVTDTYYVKTHNKVAARQRELPMYQSVMDNIGKPVVYNICMLGAVISMIDIVRPESIMKVLESRIPANLVDINKKALELGLKLGEQYNK
ncbi:MAG: 2-oxoacid:ferredoxin oxidoreductase subunit gamma [Desulfobacterium sp.]|nr:2-oxoacid:ferredoxin oxidoreductase subunit gamma [Desulfobacterium sp.]MBU3949401.1 2-oxoacid:acceptor oxidoreductase family protein [Pseudomonadota bacterium]MBU4037255.1 2-oxoacid:acceptor oxidoreductase family protein [Pseudomonadota bacterium]